MHPSSAATGGSAAGTGRRAAVRPVPHAGPAPEDMDLVLAHTRDVWRALEGARLLVTGGTGFVGRWLLWSLKAANARLNTRASAVVLTRDPAAFRRAAPALAGDPALTLWPGDVRTCRLPQGAFSHVIHAATDTSVAAATDPYALIDTVVHGTRRVLDLALRAGADAFLLTSSGAVYGPQPPDLERVPETYGGAPDPMDPEAAYGHAKRLAEQLCVLHHRRHGLNTKVARCFAFVGPYLPLDGHFAIGNFIRDALDGDAVRVRGDGTPVRSYLYAADLAAWLWTILVQGAPGTAYNVGSDRSMPVAEVARLVGATLAPDKPVVVAGEAPPGPRARYVPSVERARRELGLTAWTDLATAVRRTAEWHRRAAATTPPEPIDPRPPAPAAGAAPQAGAAPPAGAAPATFVVDVDGVVASLTPADDYTLAKPLGAAIAAVNRLHDAGHRIVMFTARGSATGIEWEAFTRAQLAAWGLKFHELRLGKPAATYYVDDRLLSVSELLEMAADA
jgi:nucleoside-diphosphate-sugar epimerase